MAMGTGDDRGRSQQGNADDHEDRTAEKSSEMITSSSNSSDHDQVGEPDTNNHHAIPRQSFDNWPGNSQHDGQAHSQTPVDNHG